MRSKDKLEIIDAIRIYGDAQIAPVLAEFRAYRAELLAFREEAQAHMERMEEKFTANERDIAEIMKRLFPNGDS